jgi:hypothetical protein
MEFKGYKYTNIEDAIIARKNCADYYGLPVSHDNTTIYWVNFDETEGDDKFWYIRYDDSLLEVLGEPVNIIL